MRTSKLYICIVSLVLLFVGCAREGKEKPLKQFMNNTHLKFNDYQYFVFVNVDACESCSDPIKEFIDLNQENAELAVILSSVSSKKAGFLISDYRGLANVTIDSTQRALKEHQLHNTIPLIYFKHNDKIEHEELTLGELRETWIKGRYTF